MVLSISIGSASLSSLKTLLFPLLKSCSLKPVGLTFQDVKDGLTELDIEYRKPLVQLRRERVCKLLQDIPDCDFRCQLSSPCPR